jgi:hypothetical protein
LDKDLAAGQSEWLGQFRSDVETFLTREALESVISVGVREIPFSTNYSYTGFCDPSGGARDSFTLGISHLEKGVRILDCLRSRRPPFNPSQVVEQYTKDLKAYNISVVHGDRYSAQWVVEAFQNHGISYKPCDRSKSQIYSELLPMVNSGKVALLDNEQLFRQFLGLERRVGGSGRDIVDHGVRGFDDLCNSAAGALVYLADTTDFEITVTRSQAIDYQSQYAQDY